MHLAKLAPAVSFATLAAVAAPTLRWGVEGHEMAARAAVAVLPAQAPAFFRAAGDQLVYLDPEPDRWRNRDMPEMDNAFAYDHYIDLENVPAAALEAPHRFAYLDLLYEAGLERPERDGGFLPFRIVELYQRLVTQWRLWRAEADPVRRGWIEQRIVNDAGVLGHYVTDASQPHHATIHFNGWNASSPNPEGYTLDRTFHARFESDFVAAHLTQAHISARVTAPPRSLVGSVRETVVEYVQASNAQVETLYRLDRDFGFDPARPAHALTRDFAAERLAVGARMLADLWWS
ncbi:MAG TPA: hypothetical protein VMM35_00580, partial [Longimicrobiales bacterium]|nr:hypothetical protein [Longimicrobiales bacterium]